MGEKSRAGWSVVIKFCPKCKRVIDSCKCKKKKGGLSKLKFRQFDPLTGEPKEEK